MVRGSELAVVLSVCDEKSGRLVPLRAGYLRVHIDESGDVFLAFAPADSQVAPIATNLHLDMTIAEAISAIGTDGVNIAKWLQNGAT